MLSKDDKPQRRQGNHHKGEKAKTGIKLSTFCIYGLLSPRL